MCSRPISKISIVGAVIQKTMKSKWNHEKSTYVTHIKKLFLLVTHMSVTLKIDDGTGVLECSKVLTEATRVYSDLANGDTLCIHGTLCIYQE